jgi:Carboxypeptidase regulatory-like domain
MLLMRMRHPHLLAVSLAFLCPLCPGQAPTRYTVSGVVVNSATEEPIRRALVAVGATLVFTGADGRFRAENVPGGQLQIGAQKPGYFECATQACDPFHTLARVMVNVQAGMPDVSLKLIPESKIEGRIVDGDGEPISGVAIQALSERIFEGEKHLNPDGRAITDDNGSYRIENLMPGAYIVKTASHAPFRSDASTGATAQVYPPRFYPNAPEASSAQMLELRPGQIARADFTLEPVRSFRVSGSLTPSVPYLMVNVEDSEGVAVSPRIQVNSKAGTFSVGPLPAGAWTIDFAYNQPEGPRLIATETVTVGPNDVKGLQVQLQPYASVPVHASSEAAQIQLVSTESRWRGGIFGDSGQPAGEGPREIQNIRPGRYRAFVVNSGEQCLDSLTSGNVDLTREDLVIAPGSQPQPINVSLRSDCGSVQAAVRSASQNAPVAVLLIPASRAIRPIHIELDTAGAYTFTGLSPGEYQLYAFSTIEGLEYANPEVMRDFSGQQITLAPNQHASVTLDVITR